MTERPNGDQIDQILAERMIDEGGPDYSKESKNDLRSQKPKIIRHFQDPQFEADWNKIVGNDQKIMGD